MAPSIWLFFFLSVVLTLPLFAFVPLGASQTRKVAPLCGIFDAFQQKISDAFANDMEYSEKDNPGRRLATISTEKSMRNARKISASDFIDSRWEVNITVKGIPRNDESSDLYAAKSVWGKQNGVAFSINFKALRDGVLDIEENDFTSSGVNGKWQLDEKDSTTLAFALPCDGFERSIKTVGTITNVMGGENTDRTTSFYFVPQGTCLIQSAIVMNTSGRLIISKGKLFSKHPQDQTGSKILNPTQGKWKQVGTIDSAKQLQSEDHTDISIASSNAKDRKSEESSFKSGFER